MSFSDFIVDLTALKENAHTIKKVIGKKTKLCAMVKADAYGHGIKLCANALDKIVDYFGVACVREAKELRKFGIKTPILICSIIKYETINWCAQNNVTISITSLNDAKTVKNLVKHPLKVHIKINSGMNRYGFSSLDEFQTGLNILKSNPNIIIEGIFTHFATKSENVSFIEKQSKTFATYVNLINHKDILVHCCNSYAGLHLPHLRMNMIRSGFAIYGYQIANCNLKPVLSIKSKILNIHSVRAGESIGYCRTYFTKKDSEIGIIPLGYADGFDRRLSNNAYILIHGKRAKVVGNVCMDVFMVDVTDIDNVKSGDEVTILGRDGKEILTTKTYADWLGTSEYDILLKFSYQRMNVVIK